MTANGIDTLEDLMVELGTKDMTVTELLDMVESAVRGQVLKSHGRACRMEIRLRLERSK